jgi:pSer/pThr/pTyr-binding forkhead associated (FHA) protein
VHIPVHTPVAATGGGRPVVCELISADGGRDIDLTHRAERLTVGRVGTAVVLDDERVSSRHAELVPAPGGQWLLDDTGSLNGTWVNGRRVERASLVHGDEVRFASSGPRFLFSRLAGAGR